MKTKRLLLVLLIVAAVMASFAPRLAAGEQKAALRIQKLRYTLDGNGQAWLSVRFVNEGNASIHVNAFAPAQEGPWSAVKEDVGPGSTVRGQVKAVDGNVAVIWVDSSQGLLRFEVPKRR